MGCQKCNSKRTATVQAHCSDMCFVQMDGTEKSGYVPDDMGIGGSDDVIFEYCLDCGQMQGEFPIQKTEIESKESDEEL